MTKETTIYKITCLPTEKAYIGITSASLRVRWNNHVSSANRADHSKVNVPRLWRAIRKHGRDQFRVEVLFTVKTRKEAEEAERQMIIAHGTLSPNGMNLTAGGEGTSGYSKPHTEETKRKIAAGNTGRVHSEESRHLMSIARKGKKQRPEHTAKSAAARTGKKHSKEWRDNIADGHRGRSFPKRSIALLQTAVAGGFQSTTGYRGVIKDSQSTWTARIGINGRRINLGTFKTPEEASLAYQAAVAARIASLGPVEPTPVLPPPPIFIEAPKSARKARVLKPLPLFEYAEAA